MRSPSRSGIGLVIRSPFKNVPFLLPTSRTDRPPLGPTVSSAWTRDTMPSLPSTGRTSHSLPRPMRMRVPCASNRLPVAVAMSVTP
jgi:hypothetical protein